MIQSPLEVAAWTEEGHHQTMATEEIAEALDDGVPMMTDTRQRRNGTNRGAAEQSAEAEVQVVPGLKAMSGKKRASRRYVVCIRNEGNEASLERNKLYVAIPDRGAEADGLIRVIDEDGEDYLYPTVWFVAVAVPKVVEQSLLKAS